MMRYGHVHRPTPGHSPSDESLSIDVAVAVSLKEVMDHLLHVGDGAFTTAAHKSRAALINPCPNGDINPLNITRLLVTRHRCGRCMHLHRQFFQHDGNQNQNQPSPDA